jgi:hypothetical protein
VDSPCGGHALITLETDALHGDGTRLTAADPIALAPPGSLKKQKNRPKQPKPYNPNRAVTNSSMTPVTIPGMTGHDAGIIGHDQRNTHSADFLINYERRRAQGRSISSAGAESAVDYVIGQRMKRNGHMRWSQEGANALLQVRCAVLNGQDVRNFVRWYSPDRRVERQCEPALTT